MTSRSEDRARGVAEELGGRGFAYDSGEAGAGARLAEAVASAFGAPVEILVANTGGPPSGADPRAGFTREQWERAYRDLVLGRSTGPLVAPACASGAGDGS